MKLHELEEELKMNDLPIVKGKVEPASRKYYLTNFVLIQFVCREYGISQDKLEIALESFFDKRGITGMKQFEGVNSMSFEGSVSMSLDRRQPTKFGC